MNLALVDTAAMPLWTGEEEAPQPTYHWGTYTDLGPFEPKWSMAGFVPMLQRIEHHGRHNIQLRRGQLKRWIRNKALQIGEFLVGAFQPIRDAV